MAKIQSIYILFRSKYDQYTVCDSSTCKGKETFTSAEGGSESQRIMNTGLPLPPFVKRRGGGVAFIWGLSGKSDK